MSETEVQTSAQKQKASTGVLAFWISLFLISGTCSLIFGKLLYQTQSIGRDGQLHHFEKPWFSNFIMFLGMSFLFCRFEINACINDKKIAKNPELAESLLNAENKRPQKSVYYKVFAPAFCDFLASFIMFVGLLWIPVSIWQMIRGSIIIFTGLIRQYWLKKPLNKAEWWSLVVIFLSLVLVGMASIFNSDSSSGDTTSIGLKILGIVLVFVAQGIQALQTVIEEHLLQGIEAPATMVVGMEGVWGFLLTAFVALPIAYVLPGEEGQGLHEDFIDSLIMCKNSVMVLTLNLLSVVVLLLFNMSSMRVTLYTNSIVRNLLEPVRTFLVWGTTVVIHYFAPDFGEGLSVWSWLQLGGFVVLTVGMLMFNGTIRCCRKENSEESAVLIEDKEKNSSA